MKLTIEGIADRYAVMPWGQPKKCNLSRACSPLLAPGDRCECSAVKPVCQRREEDMPTLVLCEAQGDVERRPAPPDGNTAHHDIFWGVNGCTQNPVTQVRRKARGDTPSRRVCKQWPCKQDGARGQDSLDP